MNHPDLCCGSAGLYMLTQPEMATRLLDDKMHDVARTGASTIVTANPGCMMQLSSGLVRAGLRGVLAWYVIGPDRSRGLELLANEVRQHVV